MATSRIVLPTYGLNLEHRCNEQKSSRYYKLTWKHLTIPTEDVKDTLNNALSYNFHGVSSHIVMNSLHYAFACPYNGLYWDETQGFFLDCSLEILLDAGVTTNCATSPCGQAHLTIPLDGQIPSVESYQTSGLDILVIEGATTRDRRTVFDRLQEE
jgi:hypothetical protein